MEQAEDEVEATVSMPFRVAALGGKVPVTLPMAAVCPTCGGDGAAPGATISVCPECKGRGTISFGQGGFAVNRPCPVCRGKGRVPSERCATCQGIEKNGRRGDQYVEVRVEIPDRLTPEQQAALKAFAEKAGLKY